MIFKGDDFVNRYRIQGELTAISPIHIGTGETRPEPRDNNNQQNGEAETAEISTIARDVSGLPYIPGSTLKGNLRHFLLQIFRGTYPNIARDPDFESEHFRKMDQEAQIKYLESASLLEQVFGTPFAEGKVEFWDAPAIDKVTAPNFAQKGWNEAAQCYVVKSVSIDPITGAAEPHKLYAFEVSPPGLRYEVNLVGQNLQPEELGLVLFGLHGFNSEIFPLTVGAMSGRGFGRMRFEVKAIYALDSGDIGNWVKLAAASNHAGYNALPKVTRPATEIIQEFKDKFLHKMEAAS